MLDILISVLLNQIKEYMSNHSIFRLDISC